MLDQTGANDILCAKDKNSPAKIDDGYQFISIKSTRWSYCVCTDVRFLFYLA